MLTLYLDGHHFDISLSLIIYEVHGLVQGGRKVRPIASQQDQNKPNIAS